MAYPVEWRKWLNRRDNLAKKFHLSPLNVDLAGIHLEKGSQKGSQKIIEFMRNDPTITIADLALRVGITDRAIKKQIEKLKAQDRIRRIGPDKGGYWVVRD